MREYLTKLSNTPSIRRMRKSANAASKPSIQTLSARLSSPKVAPKTSKPSYPSLKEDMSCVDRELLPLGVMTILWKRRVA
jgi:hypothetical protein